jgi:hypothetical protein
MSDGWRSRDRTCSAETQKDQGSYARRFAAIASFVLAAACGADNASPPPSQTGQSCTAAAQCYPGLQEGGALHGTVTCLTQISGGYCTHTCAEDTDCCAIDGECTASRPQLCAPFESTAQKYCFLSCEDSVVKAAGAADANTYCTTYGSTTFTCRSTGGGAQNRKFCSP